LFLQRQRANIAATMRLPYFLSALVALVPTVTAQTVFPKAPGLTFLYSLNCTLGESLAVGNVPDGNRVVIPITGGTFSGPRISGNSFLLLPMQNNV
jgi:hypothetical protein